MLSTTTFLLSKTFLLSQFSPPSAAHNIADTHLPLCDPTWLSFIKILPPLCSPCFQLHSFYKKHSFYHNFPPPLQPTTLPTHICLCATLPDFLLSKFSPPSATHAFNYNIPFLKNIPFIKIFPPLCSPQHSRHKFAFVRPYLTSFYQNFPPLCSPCFQLHSFYQKHSFYHNPTPLQPMLSTTTFLLSKAFFLSKFSPPLQPMLSTTFLLSKTFLLSQFSPPSAAHAFNYNIPFIKNITFITISPPSAEASKLLHLPHKSHLTLPNKHV